VVYAVDPKHRGKLLWKSRIGRGGPLGGIEWGGAADRVTPTSHYRITIFSNPLAGGGLFALDLRNGKQCWHADTAKAGLCWAVRLQRGPDGPPTLIPGAVFAGSLDGHLRAYDTRDGSVLLGFRIRRRISHHKRRQGACGSMNGRKDQRL